MIKAAINLGYGRSILLWNDETRLPYCVVSQTRKLQHRYSWPRKHVIFLNIYFSNKSQFNMVYKSTVSCNYLTHFSSSIIWFNQQETESNRAHCILLSFNKPFQARKQTDVTKLQQTHRAAIITKLSVVEHKSISLLLPKTSFPSLKYCFFIKTSSFVLM